MDAVLATHGMYYVCLQVDGFNPDALSGVVKDTRFEQRLMGAGHFHARAQRIVFDGFSLDCGTYSLPVFANGSFGEGVIGLALATHCDVPMWLNGTQVKAGQLMVFTEDRELAVRTISPLWQWTVLLAPRALLQAAIHARLNREISIPERGWHLCAPAADANARLRRAVHHALKQAARWNASTSLTDACLLGDYLLDAFIGALARGSREESAVASSVRELRHEIVVRRAEAFLGDYGDEPFRSAALEVALGMSERQLERVFQDVYGVSPRRWHQVARLNEACRILLHEPTARVTDAALRSGFTHLGRFSRDYGALFGETPSATRMY
ncbi:AraC family transcriptional regulator [Pseudoxanthomonas sp. Root630]|uniref:AraC family transcriptional regulator n=1 Tax=Pseudoxanthomonas sp. Root630 TaxID=1736574 RepID=UPI000703B80D|nr:AraC family transcriptional regulator [Pseudoxanthomonas sp. Root630]KRA46303.1 hypothetical protein ASD72_03555 [Pseudoxanthomonas sp. Root630]